MNIHRAFCPYTNQRGNVLWFILLAIVLLGAITMVISRSGSSVNQSGERESASILASQIMRYAKSIEAATTQLKMSGYSENDISFENSFNTASYLNTNCSGNYCKVFHVNGTGLSMSAPPSKAMSNTSSEWIITGANAVGSTNDPVGTDNNDLIILLSGIKQPVCAEINRMMKVNNGAIPTETTGITTTSYQGSFSGSTVIDGDPSPYELDGHPTGCFYDADASNYSFYHTLIAR